MPVHVIPDGASPGTQIPTHLTRIPIRLISNTTDCSDKTVQGKVVYKGPLVSLGDDEFVLKTVIQGIQEEDSQQSSPSESLSINVVLFGGMAKDFSEAVSQGNTVVAAGFTVGKSPTVHKDKLHPCNLHLTGDDACIYVSRILLPSPRSLVDNKRSSSLAPEVSTSAKVPKYTYVPLGDLKPGVVVNVYGVVVFFKQPFKSRGTDFCSSLKITDQSNQKVGCNIFCEKLEDHPKIFQMGDIIRLHRVKTQLFNGSINLLNTFGFSVVTFDGRVGSTVVPRTSSKSFHFEQEDRQTVEALRAWSANQDFLPTVPRIPLSAVQPTAYFDLTCQLLSKAPVDTTCTLLKVWDGTKCPHPLLNVTVEPGVTEGPSSLSKDRQNLTANILVYDNHVEVARQLKPGDYLRIYNLHAVPGPSKVPVATSSGSEEADHLAFHLHRGTSYGRGIRVLPDDSPDIQELKRLAESFQEDEETDAAELNDSALLEVWSTPPESLERTCSHSVEQVTLSRVKQADPGDRFQVFHVNVQLKSYQPQRLCQSLKLYCPKCKSMQNVPDDDSLADMFKQASKDAGPCTDPWVISGTVNLPGESPKSPSRALTVHLSSGLMAEGKTKDLVFLMGSTLEETCRLAAGYRNIVPVRSSGGGLTLLDLSAPFLFRGRKRYYGCKQCSQVRVTESCSEGLVLDEKTVAEALGVQLLQYSLLMKLELQDGADTLEAVLWRDAESFFHVSAEDVAANQDSQNIIHQTMDSLCPPGSSMADRPWLDLCLSAYRVEEKGQSQVYYQICHTSSNIIHLQTVAQL
ncbi:protection of telomeres protein 1 isoform 2-T2 [Polymixia lowei]